MHQTIKLHLIKTRETTSLHTITAPSPQHPNALAVIKDTLTLGSSSLPHAATALGVP